MVKQSYSPESPHEQFFDEVFANDMSFIQVGNGIDQNNFEGSAFTCVRLCISVLDGEGMLDLGFVQGLPHISCNLLV